MNLLYCFCSVMESPTIARRAPFFRMEPGEADFLISSTAPKREAAAKASRVRQEEVIFMVFLQSGRAVVENGIRDALLKKIGLLKFVPASGRANRWSGN